MFDIPRVSVEVKSVRTIARSFLAQSSNLITLSLCAGCFLLLVLTSNRGFDFSDEGFYLLSFEDKSLSTSFTSTFDYLRPFFDFIDGNVSQFRIFGIFLLTATGLLFAATFAMVQERYFDIRYSNRVEKSAAIAFIVLGALVHYFCFIRTPNYNLLIAATSYMIAAGLNLVLVSDSKFSSLCSSFATGIAVGISFFVKFTTAPIFILIAISATFLVPPWSIKKRVTLIAAIVLGCLAWGCFHFMIVQPAHDWIGKLTSTFAYLTKLNATHRSTAVFRYATELLELVGDALIVAAIPIVIVIAGLYSRNSKTVDRLPTWLTMRTCSYAAVIFTAIATVALGYYGWQFTAKPLLAAYVAWGVTLAALVFSVREMRCCSRYALSRGSIIASVLLFPLASSAGTGNPFAINTMFAMAPFFAGILTLGQMFTRSIGTIWPTAIAVSSISMLAAAQIVSGSVHPYGVYTSVFSQNQRVDFGPPGNSLRLEPPAVKFIKELQEFGRKLNITPGRDVMVFYDAAGVTYTLRGRSPATPSYYPYSLEALKGIFSAVPADRIRHAFIFYRDREGVPFMPALPASVNFESDYKSAGKIGSSYPYGSFQVWAPKD